MDSHRKALILDALHQRIGKGKLETQQSAAVALGVDQGRISKIMNGEFTRDQGVVKRLYQLIGFDPDSVESQKVELSPILLDAIKRNWDGTERHAVQLSKVIDELGNLGRFNSSGLSQK